MKKKASKGTARTGRAPERTVAPASARTRVPARPGLRVKELMTAETRTCRPEDAMAVAAGIMWEGDCGFVPVVDAGSRLVGVITDRDICMAAYSQGRVLQDLPVSLAMARAPRRCGPDDTLAEAALAMAHHRVRRLPVVDDEGRLVGVLSLADIVARAAPGAAEQVLAVLAGVCGRPGRG